MRQSVEDVKCVASILNSSLYSTVVHEEFGEIIVRMEAREVNDGQLEALQKLSGEVSSRGNNGDGAHINFDAVSRRIYYSPPLRSPDGSSIELKVFRDALKDAGVRVLNGR